MVLFFLPMVQKYTFLIKIEMESKGKLGALRCN